MDEIQMGIIEITDLSEGKTNGGTVFPEGMPVEENGIKAEGVEVIAGANTNGAVEIAEPRANAVPTVSLKMCVRILCIFLAAVGVISYGYLSYIGVNYIKNGGLRGLVSRSVYGGLITSVSGLEDGSDEVYATEIIPPEAEIPESGNMHLTVEDIGCSDPNEVFNETDYDTDGQTVPALAVPKYTKDKAVLIIHTHGTEGYAPDGDIGADEDFRTSDPTQSVVAVGSAFAEVLEGKGIRTIHCKEMFDAESYSDSYVLSGKAVEKYLGEDPDIGYVIDMHRDAVIREDGTVVRSEGAQLMIVCGTDEGGADFPDWRENFAFGKAYQHGLYKAAPELVRHMNLRSASFNQQLAERFILLEVGTCGNTLDEAIKSAKIAAEAFADTITAG